MVVINTNISAIRSSRLLAGSTSALSKSLGRLSSGSRILSPEDDAAGLAQAVKFDAQIHRTDAALINLGNAVSFTQTQDGFLQKAQKALDRMSEIAMLALDATKTTADQANYDAEFQQLLEFVFDVGAKQFNGVNLFGNALEVTSDSDAAPFSMPELDYGGNVAFVVSGLTVDNTSDPTNAETALNTLKGDAIPGLAALRATAGANLTRLNGTIEALQTQNENMHQANSRIKDVDVAQESTEFARNTILVESGSAMLAQANFIPRSALALLM